MPDEWRGLGRERLPTNWNVARSPSSTYVISASDELVGSSRNIISCRVSTRSLVVAHNGCPKEPVPPSTRVREEVGDFSVS